MGFVGNEPQKVADNLIRLSLATHRRGYTKKDGTVVPDSADWHNLVIFSEREMKFVYSYVKKGSLLLVEGEIRYSSYTDKEGVDRVGTDILVSSVSFPYTGKKRDGVQNEDQNLTDTAEVVAGTPSQGIDDLPF